MKSRWILGALVLLAVLFFGIAFHDFDPGGAPPQEVEAAPVEVDAAWRTGSEQEIAAAAAARRAYMIELIRTDGQKFKINWHKAKENPTLDLAIMPGDQIIVRRRLW